MLHFVYGTNSPLIFVSLIRYSLLHFHLLSDISVHHLHHLHYHHFHLLSLAQSFILSLRLGFFVNPFYHRLFPRLPDDSRTLGPFNVCTALLWMQGGLMRRKLSVCRLSGVTNWKLIDMFLFQLVKSLTFIQALGLALALKFPQQKKEQTTKWKITFHSRPRTMYAIWKPQIMLG